MTTSAVPRAPSPLQIDLAQRIARQIRDGALSPGQHLTEEGLAALYDVSRTPVRVALRLLSDQGFVEQRANSGVFVADHVKRLKVDGLALGAPTEEELYRTLLTDRAQERLPATFTDADLAARYDAPRSLLTRALLRLTREGLVERRRGHGWTFAPMLDSGAARDESYRYRMLVEGGSILESTFKVDADELVRARATHERFAAQRSKSGAPAEFFEMNLSFHEMLARFSGNRFIVQTVRQQNQLRRFLEYASFANREYSLVESCKEHLQIIKALEDGDREWASALMRRHLSAASQR